MLKKYHIYKMATESTQTTDQYLPTPVFQDLI